MEFNPLSAQNWSCTFNVWIEDIEVQFRPVVRMALGGGFLRRVRGFAPVSSVLVILLFSLHCTKPRIPVSPRVSGDLPLPAGDSGYSEVGDASWYGGDGDGFEGKPTASGEVLDPDKLTCAHRTLPLGSYLSVENLTNGKRVLVRINDRGPFVRGRVVDVSWKAAKDLGFAGQGVVRVRVRAVHKDGTPASLDAAMDLNDPYTIQVAALSDPVNIQRLAKDLQDSFGAVTFQDAVSRDGHAVKRVRVGSYARVEDAEKAADQIAKRFGDRGVEPFITRRR